MFGFGKKDEMVTVKLETVEDVANLTVSAINVVADRLRAIDNDRKVIWLCLGLMTINTWAQIAKNDARDKQIQALQERIDILEGKTEEETDELKGE